MVGPLLLIGGAIAAFILTKGINTKKAGNALILDFRDITSVKRDGWKIKFNIRFDATNPTGTNLNLEQAILDLKLDGINGTIAKVRNLTPIMFSANERKIISIPAETDNLLAQGISMFLLLVSVFSGGSTKITSGVLSGTLKANGFNSDYKLDIPFKK